ncbi:hypothetical protein D3C77_498290 [compost metagenome]
MCLAVGSPIMTVLVISEQYPFIIKAPKSIFTNSLLPITRSLATPCGSAERSPEATIVSNELDVAPFLRMKISISSAISSSVTPGFNTVSICSKVLSASSAASFIKASSLSSLNTRSSSTKPETGESLIGESCSS